MVQSTHPASPKGTYLLLIHLDTDAQFQVGRLGEVCLQAGWYGYAGSARGPGGLKARLARHQRTVKKYHWHIDYLLDRASIYAIWHYESLDRLECDWARALVDNVLGTRFPVPGFGSSDCRCPAHLIQFPEPPSDEIIRQSLQNAGPRPQACYVKAQPSLVTGRSWSSSLRAHAASTSTYIPPATSE